MKTHRKDDLDKAIERHKKRSSRAAQEFDEGYEVFKVGMMLEVARHEAGLTQEELARLAGTSKSAVSRWERQPNNMRIGTLQKLAHALGLNARVALVHG